jgi:hypothetical protein
MTVHLTIELLARVALTLIILWDIYGAASRFGMPKADDVYDWMDAFWAPVTILMLLFLGGFYS